VFTVPIRKTNSKEDNMEPFRSKKEVLNRIIKLENIDDQTIKEEFINEPGYHNDHQLLEERYKLNLQCNFYFYYNFC